MKEHLVIAGAGHAAGQLVITLRQKGYPGRITLIGEEDRYPYQRPPLSKKFLSGDIDADRLLVKPVRFYDEAGVSVLRGLRVEGIDRERRTLQTSDGQTHHWDKLVIATGTRPRTLDVDGVGLPGVHYLRSIDDVEAIRTGLEDSGTVGIIGAGYIGLEVAAVVATLGRSVIVLETLDRVMHRTASPAVSAFFEAEHRRHGIDLRLSRRAVRFIGTSHVEAIETDDGERSALDLVVIGIGVVPNTELAAAAGLEVADGIVVDERCRTADPDIYAIGDCTFHPNPILGRRLRLESVPNALEQARTAAANLCGEEARYAQVPWFWSDQYDLKLQVAGLYDDRDDVVVRGNPAARSFSRLYLRDTRLRAVEAVNCPKDFMQARLLIESRQPLDPALAADEAIDVRDAVRAAPG